MKKYGKYIRPYLSAFICGPILMIVEVVGEVVLPALMADIINTGAANRDVPYILGRGAVMVLVAFLMMAGGVGGAWFSAKASISFASDLRGDVFRQVQRFSFANLDSFSTGSLVTRLTNDITQVQNVMMMMLRLMLRAPGMMIGAVIMAFLMNAQLAVIVLIVVPLLAAAIGTILRIGFSRFETMQKRIDRLNSTVQEALTNVRVIKSFVRGDYEEARFGDANQGLKEASLRAFDVVICMMPLMMLAMNATTLAVVWFGGRQILAGTMPVGDLTAFTTYIVQVLMSLMMLAMVLLQSSRAIASLKRINEVLNARIDLTDETAAQPQQTVERGKIEFRNVSFRYYRKNREKVLDHISFTVQPGETVGIIGSTGSGKTTLVQLIPRLYDADEGQVLVDDVDVRDYTLRHLRSGVGMVLQKNVLFSGSILDNLRWGDPDASDADVYAAASAAEADGFVRSFEEGYATELGQGGVNVSGGQKQRLCIARALLKRPRILILDDSTSAVDTATERRIREHFADTLQNATKIIIAQRITSVIDADQILVLEEGRIAGQGTHAQLMESCEPYREIYHSQMEAAMEAEAAVEAGAAAEAEAAAGTEAAAEAGAAAGAEAAVEAGAAMEAQGKGAQG